MSDIKVVYRDVESIIPYENNPRNNDEAVQAVVESIKEFGFKVPIILSGDGEIVAGHTRIKAAKKMGMKEVPCIIADDLSEEQTRAFRLADNKSGEIATWDEEKLQQELEGILNIDMKLFGFEDGESDFADEFVDDKYTMKTNIPQYEITGDCPEFSEMLDTGKEQELIEEIEKAEGITDEEREFLIKAAGRHNVFNYRNIAEYYARATPEMQRLMEKSALVIIDVDNAIVNGYANLMADVLDMMEDGEE
ncbi:MAG: ParB N-terminal domain-containing protein [Clostridiales bacterium]|nr:ParB N-terminal domain-containing protein [Clostridiales bacterium]